MISPEHMALEWGYLMIGVCLSALLCLAIFRYAIWPLLSFLWRRGRRPSFADGARSWPRERRLVLAARANNRRPGCVLALSVALLFGLLLMGMGLGAGWEEFDWSGRIMTIAYGLVGSAVLVLMLLNFFKNAGFRAYNGREIQLDEHELIIDRSLIDSQVPGDDMFHPHLQQYLYKKYYYRIPLGDISRFVVSAVVHSLVGTARQFPFVYIEFTTTDAVYMIQTRFMHGDGEARFLKYIEMIGTIPLFVDEKYADAYSYLAQVRTVRFD